MEFHKHLKLMKHKKEHSIRKTKKKKLILGKILRKIFFEWNFVIFQLFLGILKLNKKNITEIRGGC